LFLSNAAREDTPEAAMQRAFPFAPDDVLPTVRARLLSILGPQRDGQRLDPVSQLVPASISTQTYDRVSLRAYELLRQHYPVWALLGRASSAAIEALIRPVPHADSKAIALPAALRMIIARTGDLDLEFLVDWGEEAAMQWLEGLPGIGPKVAATILNFSTLRRRVLAVDRHLLRVGERLGLLPAKPSYQAGFDVFARRLPEDWDAETLYELHWLLKYLGQAIAPVTRRCARAARCAISAHGAASTAKHHASRGMVGPAGLEPATTPL
jgi:endonuclease-3